MWILFGLTLSGGNLSQFATIVLNIKYGISTSELFVLTTTSNDNKRVLSSATYNIVNSRDLKSALNELQIVFFCLTVSVAELNVESKMRDSLMMLIGQCRCWILSAHYGDVWFRRKMLILLSRSLMLLRWREIEIWHLSFAELLLIKVKFNGTSQSLAPCRCIWWCDGHGLFSYLQLFACRARRIGFAVEEQCETKAKYGRQEESERETNVVHFISDSDDQIDGVEGHYFTFEDVLSIFGGTYLTVNYGQERKNTNRDDTLNSWTVGGSYCCWIGLCFVDCCIQMALTFETHD